MSDTVTQTAVDLAPQSPPLPERPAPVIVERVMRADARRNRERILVAARAAYAAQGREVQCDEIAQLAGVGVGTLYRHFPTKSSLAGALAFEHFEALCVIAAAALEAPGSPGERFTMMIWDAARLAERDAAIAEALAGEPELFDYVEEPLGRLQEIGAKLVDAAVASGELRSDATVDDVPVIMCGLGQVMATTGKRPGAGWERYLTIALDGMRPRGS